GSAFSVGGIGTEDYSATLLGSGKVLIAGGRTRDGVTSNAYLWNPDTNAREPAGAFDFAREGHRAVLLPSGAVLVWGGHGASGEAVQFAEVFDPELTRFVRFDEFQRARLPTVALAERAPEAMSVTLTARASAVDFLPAILF